MTTKEPPLLHCWTSVHLAIVLITTLLVAWLQSRVGLEGHVLKWIRSSFMDRTQCVSFWWRCLVEIHVTFRRSSQAIFGTPPIPLLNSRCLPNHYSVGSEMAIRMPMTHGRRHTSYSKAVFLEILFVGLGGGIRGQTLRHSKSYPSLTFKYLAMHYLALSATILP